MRLTLLVFTLAITGCTKSPAADRTRCVILESQIVGSWRSENVGLDFPMWLVDTYRADGTVTTVLYSKPRTEEVRHEDKAINHFWRLTNGALEVGNKTDAGVFERRNAAAAGCHK